MAPVVSDVCKLAKKWGEGEAGKEELSKLPSEERLLQRKRKP